MVPKVTAPRMDKQKAPPAKVRPRVRRGAKRVGGESVVVAVVVAGVVAGRAVKAAPQQAPPQADRPGERWRKCSCILPPACRGFFTQDVVAASRGYVGVRDHLRLPHPFISCRFLPELSDR